MANFMDLPKVVREKIYRLYLVADQQPVTFEAYKQTCGCTEAIGDYEGIDLKTLRDNGVDNVQVLQRDAAVDVPAGGFDVIALSGSVAELPQHLLAARNDGGRLIACVGEDPIMRIHVVTKRDGQFDVQTPWDYNLPRLQNFPEASAFEF